jgi:steroid delta-isomerase-like uncharacterized protein
MSEQNLAVMRATIAAWNAHDADAWVKQFAEDAVYESESVPRSPLTGHSAIRQLIAIYTGAFPDTHLEIMQEIASGPFVVLRVKATGTHRGELTGIPATNRRASLELCFISEFRNGKIIRSWNYWDNVTLLRQLGVMPVQS